MANIDVDKILLSLGWFGPYQRQQCVYFALAMTGAAYAILAYIFAAYRPPFACDVPVNNSLVASVVNGTDIQLIGSTCEINVVKNKTNSSGHDVLMTLPCHYGYNYDIQQDTVITEWDLVCQSEGKGGLTQSMVTFGQMFGSVIFLPLADRYGRKKIMISVGFSMFLVATLISLSPNYYVYIAMKFLTGATLEGYGMTMYTYIFEMFPGKYRSYIGIFGAFWWSTNVITLTAFGYGLQNYSWRILHLALGLMAFINLFIFWLCDESLRWLVANGKMKEAQKLIQKIAMKNKKDPDKIVPLLSSLDSEAENGVVYEKEEKINNDIHVTSPVNPVSSAIDPVTSEVNPVTSRSSNNPTVLDIFRNAFVCKIALIWMFTWFTNGMTYYGLLYSSVQLEGSRFLNFFVNGLVEYPSCVVFAILVNMNSISRKKLTIGFHLLAGIAMILSVVLISFREKHEIFVKLAIACSFIAKTGIAGSYNSIFIYTPETFPTNLRNMGIGIGAFGSHIGGVIAPFATLLAFHVEWGPGVVFGACCLIVSFLLLFLPETKGRPLPQTIMEMKQWNKKHCNQSDEKTIYVN
ncbi:MFS transporter, OCT family, solute carrier family 22 (organic cation transporter), member 4/5 [Mytilus galloprovincialis]|uniref:MFS transporter, OCT family, solute carrier family 22 (Organic cation transporter), member 4/5 n=1 Tax=Mytilus galloprovincialis TaxID=29158 RepID=A0A8B6GSP3_MYTGA|nr:MFS transporter, OCT family, solute carrier family 22 (organic cation transporter), member 4/5 [Mytilus galloprovincialis]